MLHGLMLTSLTVLVARTALFQRKSRAGFLDELDEIRSSALDSGEPDGDLWTDLREGGEYSDPHEISGLYADDKTPDQPKAKRSGHRPQARPEPRRGPAEQPPATSVEPPLPAPPPPPAPPVEDAPPPPAAVEAAPIESAPHPVRPSEMWHSANDAPEALGEPLAPIETGPIEMASFDTATLASSEPSASAPPEAPEAPPVDPFEVEAGEPPAETEPIVDYSGGLVSGPVGRRNRRDRPQARKRSTLRSTPAVAAETLDLVDPAPVAPGPEPVVPGADGMVVVSGALVRVETGFDGEAHRLDSSLTVGLRRGWCWVAPGEGEPMEVSVELPNSRLVAQAGSTVLAVVEADGSSFVVVAAGTVTLGRDDDVAPLERGAIVLVDPAGAAQVDQAEPHEIEADPLVAANLAFDAEL